TAPPRPGRRTTTAPAPRLAPRALARLTALPASGSLPLRNKPSWRRIGGAQDSETDASLTNG
ncbi:hypothetical protein, partial [Lysobacter enzymogenes]|uniref:hypothetical protein n=1 Tax=Lysobacter enzymogenes TaxID=69 RepID=UPI0019D23448